MPASPLLLTSTALRRIETDAAATLPPGSLMDRAARSAAARIATSWPSGAVVVLCGPGNNGGDGLVLARMLHEAGRHVKVWALPAAEAGRPADAQRAWDALPAGLLQTGEPVWPAGSAAADAAHAADGSGGSAGGDDGPGADEGRGAMGAAAVDADVPGAVDATADDVTPTEVTPTEVIPADVTAEDVTGEDVTAADVPAEDVAATYVAAENLSADDVTGEILSDDDLSEEPLSTGALFDAPLLDQGRITDGLLLDGDAPRGVIVDALFGIGLTRPLDAQARAWVAWANAQPVARLAMDVPSGLDADTGTAQDVCVQATHTLTFIADKPGLHTRAGSDVAGTIEVDDLQLSVFVDAAADASASPEAGSYGGSDAEARPDVTDRATHRVGRPANPIGHLIRKADCASLFQTRKHDTHKGSYGTLAVLAGAPGMTGAALLASRAALLTGAGKIFVALADTPPLSLPCDPVHPELMVRDATGVLDAADALGIGTWVAGCGLGTHDAARGWLTRVLRERPDANVVLDADALTLLAADPGLQTLFRQRQGVKVLTPHPLEAARLLGGDTHAVQADRIAAACAIASRFGAWVVLKGAGTVVSSPAGAWRVNTSGNPGLATAGTGDVLSGMLGALVAQGLPPEDAIGGGVWLHGAAADRLVEQGIGPIGLTASDVADAARWIRNHG